MEAPGVELAMETCALELAFCSQELMFVNISLGLNALIILLTQPDYQ